MPPPTAVSLSQFELSPVKSRSQRRYQPPHEQPYTYRAGTNGGTFRSRSTFSEDSAAHSVESQSVTGPNLLSLKTPSKNTEFRSLNRYTGSAQAVQQRGSSQSAQAKPRSSSTSENDCAVFVSSGSDSSRKRHGKKTSTFFRAAMNDDPKATRHSKRTEARKTVHYNTKHHPQDYAIPGYRGKHAHIPGGTQDTRPAKRKCAQIIAQTAAAENTPCPEAYLYREDPEQSRNQPFTVKEALAMLRNETAALTQAHKNHQVDSHNAVPACDMSDDINISNGQLSASPEEQEENANQQADDYSPLDDLLNIEVLQNVDLDDRLVSVVSKLSSHIKDRLMQILSHEHQSTLPSTVHQLSNLPSPRQAIARFRFFSEDTTDSSVLPTSAQQHRVIPMDEIDNNLPTTRAEEPGMANRSPPDSKVTALHASSPGSFENELSDWEVATALVNEFSEHSEERFFI